MGTEMATPTTVIAQVSKTVKENNWDLVIKPETSLLSLHLQDLWRYRDLLVMFVRRDVVTVYKQTVLGPIWYVLQPILTTIVFMFIFGNIAGISTDGLPQALFYFSGITIWNYFSETFTQTSKTFKENENLFGKVYFPRLVMPISKVVSGLIKFAIQFGFFLVLYGYFLVNGYAIQPTVYILLFPFLLVLMAGMGLGFGIIFTSLTAKYRDLTFLIQFGVQLLMYATPVIYPVSTIPERYKVFILANPMSAVIEAFRFGFLGSGSINFWYLGYSTIFMLIILFLGILIFNKTEKTFIDTV